MTQVRILTVDNQGIEIANMPPDNVLALQQAVADGDPVHLLLDEDDDQRAAMVVIPHHAIVRVEFELGDDSHESS